MRQRSTSTRHVCASDEDTPPSRSKSNVTTPELLWQDVQEFCTSCSASLRQTVSSSNMRGLCGATKQYQCSFKTKFMLKGTDNSDFRLHALLLIRALLHAVSHYNIFLVRRSGQYSRCVREQDRLREFQQTCHTIQVCRVSFIIQWSKTENVSPFLILYKS